ncbi:MAG: acyltransferase [Bacilli bacterium]|nr:acyltransferase [Bacilli bacterium]
MDEVLSVLAPSYQMATESAVSRGGKFKKVWGRGNVVSAFGSTFTRCQITFGGENNRIEIGEGANMVECKIHVMGSNNVIRIGKKASAYGLSIWVSDNGNEVSIGDNFYGSGSMGINCSEGTKVSFGNDCLASRGVMCMSSDSHSILSPWGKRVNPAKDIVIADHVWIGYGVTILKGVRIAKNCVVGASSVLTKAFDDENTLIVGNPAKAKKKIGGWRVKKIVGGISPLEMD